MLTEARVGGFLLIIIAAAGLAAPAARAQTSADTALIEALRAGGHVIVMRHASSDREAPTGFQRAPGNVDGERQLNEHGLATITAMRFAFRELDIPVGRVLSSPAYRARETANHLGLGELEVHAELDSDGMGSSVAEARAQWLRQRANEAPAGAANTVIITHSPNLRAAFGDDGTLDEGGALVFDGQGEIVATVAIEDWAPLAL